VDVPEMNPTPADLQRVSEIVERTQLRALALTPGGNRSFNALAKGSWSEDSACLTPWKPAVRKHRGTRVTYSP